MTTQRRKQINWYKWLHRSYFIASVLLVSISLILSIRYFLTPLQDTVTAFDLFLVVLLVLLALYFRINALHYHQLVVRLELPRHTSERRPPLEKGGRKRG